MTESTDQRYRKSLAFKNPEEAQRVNGMVPNETYRTIPKRSDTTMQEQPNEGTVGDVTSLEEEYAKERTMEARTLSQAPKCKGKQPVARSLHKKTTTTTVLPRIPEGVHVTGNLLFHVEKLW
jgi:hypothetical protein